MATDVVKRLFNVDEFHQMAEARVFAAGDRLELLDGEIVRMTPIGSRHAACVARLTELLIERCRTKAIVGVQNPLALDAANEFYPDITLLERRADYSSEALPSPRDTLLVVEVSDTTGTYDRGVKASHYARAGVPELWIVDLRGRAVDVYRRPAGDRYRDHERFAPDDALPLPRMEGRTVAVADVLG